MSRLSEAMSARQGSSLLFSSHFAWWLNIESMTWTNASYVEKKPCRPVNR
jgi:hypothetical protein